MFTCEKCHREKPEHECVRLNRGVSFVIEPDETAAIVGHTGAGKTTITKWLATKLAMSSNDRLSLPPALLPWADRIPFIVPLRYLSGVLDDRALLGAVNEEIVVVGTIPVRRDRMKSAARSSLHTGMQGQQILEVAPLQG